MCSKANIEEFLTNAKERDRELGEISCALRDLAEKNHPDATEEIKYGGICFFDAGLLVGGIFQSKKHVSLEFSEGASFEDPNGLLEGTGKYRRHLKIRSLEEIVEKNVVYYLKQAFHE